MSLKDDEAYVFRAYVPDDLNFVSNSWGSSYYQGAQYKTTLSPSEFHEYHRPHRNALFNNPHASIICCVSKDDTNQILGWIAIEKPKSSPGMILHYVYVKQAFKGFGIAKELAKRALIDGPVTFTHATERAWKIMDASNKFKDWFYRPHVF